MCIYLVAIWMSLISHCKLNIYLSCCNLHVNHGSTFHLNVMALLFLLVGMHSSTHQSKVMPPAPITRQLNTVSSLKKTNPLTICSEDGESVTKSIGCAGWLRTTSNQAFFSSITAAASCFLMCLGFPYMSQKSYPSLLKLPSLVLDCCNIQITHQSITGTHSLKPPEPEKLWKISRTGKKTSTSCKTVFFVGIKQPLSLSLMVERDEIPQIGGDNCSLECCQNCQPLHHPQSRHIYENRRGEKKKDLLQT